MMPRFVRLLVFALFPGLSGGCSLVIPKAAVPMPLTFASPRQAAPRLMVLLPGRGDRMATFREQGFFDLATDYLEANRDVALVAADAHIGYYRDRQVMVRLEEDLLGRFPESRLTVVGVSLGGLGAVMLGRRHPARIQELFLIAPYLGDRSFVERVAAGPISERSGDGDLERELVAVWRFLLDRDARAGIVVTVGIGDRDRFIEAARLLERRAPDITVHTVSGKHQWSAWRTLFQGWLARH